MTAPSILPKILLGVALLGATAGVVGSFAVLRRRSLVGDTLAHASLPGICLAFMAFASRDILVLSAGALVAGLLGVLCVTTIPRWTRTREDAALGLVLSTFFGVGVVLLSVIQQREMSGQAGLDSYLFGEIASLTTNDIARLTVVGLVAVGLVAVFFKEIKILCFDEQFAGAQGWPVFAIDLGVMALIAVVTIISLPICGVILIAAILIFPCTTARYWADQLGPVVILAGVLGAGSAVAGVLSVLVFGDATSALPPGPMIVLTSAAVFVFSLLFAPRKGLAARALHRTRLRVEVVTDHLLRIAYELVEERLPEAQDIDRSLLFERLACDQLTRRLVLWRARSHGWFEEASNDFRLTDQGLAAAASVARTHRLWEQFLVTHADIAADHVHRDADDLEHFLPPELVSALEQQLATDGRLPVANPQLNVPASPHAVDQPSAD